MSDSYNSYLANLGDVTIEQQVPPTGIEQQQQQPSDGKPNEPASMMDAGGQAVNQQEDTSNADDRSQPVSPQRRDDLEEMRAEGSADDMELDDTIDSRIGMRMENEGESQDMRPERLDQMIADADNADSMDAVNLLDSLPLEGAPIEGEEVSEAFLLGKDEDEDEAEEDKASTRSDDVDESGKRLGEHDDNLDPAKKKQKKDDGTEGSNDPEGDKKIDKKSANMRRNIREVMDETQLDEATLAAQRQEMERLRRVQEQQRIIREVQRRQQINKGNSLLRSNVVGVEDDEIDEVRLPSSVQLKVNSNLSTGGQVSVSQQSTLAPRRPMAESCRWQKGGQTSLSRVPAQRGTTQQNAAQQRVRMMTPSVSISPVVASKKEPVEHLEYYTDSDLSDVDVDYADADDDVIIAEKQIMRSKMPGTAQKAGKGKDVVTISSSSESSDDDCIVLSDPSEEEETDNDDDPANSGMHTNDRYNVPDAQGRVLVNVGHPEDEPDVFLAPQIARIIKPHQIGGIRFLYDNIVESIERFKTSTGFGCILAHSMGLGKTLQVACFCDIFFRCTDAKTVLCIMPINTLQNWLAEFNMWLPYEDPNKSKVEEKANIKEESNQSDLGYMSRQSSEQDSSTSSMMPETPPYPPPHPSYNPQAYNPYAPPGNMYDPRYAAPYPGYKPDPYGMPQYNYPPPPPPTVPNYQDPHNPYPGYGISYPGYGVQPPRPPEAPTEVKKENLPAAPAPPPPAPAENSVKTEPGVKEESKKESTEETPKKDEKDPVTVKTPFSVDAPSDLEIRPRHFALHILNDSHKTMAARARVIREWQKVGGVLLIGYELYRQLSLKKPNKAKRKRGQPFKDPMADDEDNNKNKPLLDEMNTALVNPGPDLVICDEGHRIKNSHASISLALKQMRTKRRIVLTGYPLQNNLLEYWCMVDFVRPNYLGTKSEFSNMFERPIHNGQCIDSTPQDIRLMRYRAHVLHSLLEGFVQRRSHSVLQTSLPRKEEYILLVRMTPHQRKLYDTFMNQVVKTRAVPNPLKAFAVCCKIWNHPDVLYHFLKKRQANEEDDLDLEERDEADKAATGAGIKKTPKARAPKGEGKKGKKGSPKNKPAASVQPNSSAMPIENGESGEQKPPGFQNFNAPPPPAGQGSAFPQQQNNYQQSQQGGYQNYQGGEYNNYYGNQNQQSQYPPNNQNQQGQTTTQQSYPPTGNQTQQQNQQQPYPPTNNPNQQSYPQQTGNQTFPPYAQNNSSNYTSNNQTPQPSQQHQQQYPQTPQPQQQQNYNERFPGPSPTGPSPSPSIQTSPGSASNYPRSSYPYQNSDNANYQGQNYPQAGGYQNQQSSQVGSSSYGNYPPSDRGYGSTSGPTNYNTGSQQQQPQQQQSSQTTPNYQQQQHQQPSNTPTPNYPSNQQTPGPYSQPSSGQTNQQYSNPTAPHQPYVNTAAQPYSNSTTQQQNQQYSNANAPTNQQSYPSSQPQLHQPYANNTSQAGQQQSGSYTGTSSTTSNPSNVPYNPNQTQQQSQQQPSQQQQGYQGKGGYQNQSSTYQQGQGAVQQGQFDYNSQQQQPYQQQSSQQQQSQSQQYQQPPGQQQQSQPYQQPAGQQQQQSQSQQYQQQPQGYNQQTPGYQQTNQQAQQPTQQGYQQNQVNSTNSSGQSYGYQSQSNQPAQNYQQPVQQTKSEPAYGYQSGNNYPSTTNNDAPIPAASQTPNNPQQGSAQGQNQYWQGNYQNPNDPYYNQNSNQYQGNYQPNASGNYHANQQPQQQGQYQNYPTDSKAPQQNQSSVNQQPTNSATPYNNPASVQSITEPLKDDEKAKMDQEKDKLLDKDKEDKSDDEAIIKDENEKGTGMAINVFKDQEPGIPYDWATELMKGYVPGLIDASAKMTIFFCILEEAILLGDRVLAFSQSLFTLNLIEDFLARNDFKYVDGKTESWVKNTNYFRLDGSTSALERERLINEFNANPKIHLFLVSTRAGSLGINLVGANRAIVFDASWNPCHDTQAVCRVYRYGQQKNCYVYRLVTDNCLERKIYDRQISKQGMSDRVVDQCNPDAHLSLKEATTLNWDWEEDSDPQDFSEAKDKFPDEVMHIVLEKHSTLLTKQPFHHESLLVDRKDKKLSQAEKRLARRGYELEKMAATSSKPSYNYVPGNTAARVAVQSGGLQIRQTTPKPVASVRPMQQRGAEGLSRNPGGSRWIPAEVWQRQGMSAQEMTLPLDVVIPTNSPDKGSIVLKAGQRVMVLKSPKGIYMQLESGKIIAIRTALKVNQGGKKDEEPKKSITPGPQRNNIINKGEVSFPLRNNSAISIIPKSSTSSAPIQPVQRAHPINMRPGATYRPFGEKEVVNRRKTVATAAAKPYNSQFNSHQVPMPRINNKPKLDYMGDNSNSSDGHHKIRSEQRIEEVRIEDVVSEKGSNSEYSPASSRLSNSDTDTNLPRPMMESKRGTNFHLDNHSMRPSHGMHTPQYPVDPKINAPRKLQDMNRQKDRKSDSSDDIIIEDPSKRLHQPFQPYQQPTRPQPRPAIPPPRGETSKQTPVPIPSSKPGAEMESQPLTGYPYAQYPRYYDYTDPRTRPLGADPYGSTGYFPPKPTEEKPKSTAEATGFSRPTPKETTQPPKPTETAPAASSSISSTAPVREDPHGPTAFSHPSSVRPAYPPAGPYPPYDPYAQHYPAPAGSTAYSAGAAAAAASYPAYGTPSYNADYARMYPGFPAAAPPPPPTAADPYRSYGPPPAAAAGPASNYYAPFTHAPPPPYPNYSSFLPGYPNPGVPAAEPQPPPTAP